MIVLVGGEKGGTGKSTTSQNLAVYCSKMLSMNIVLVDADPQKSTTKWAQRRANMAGVRKIVSVSMVGDIRQKLIDLNRRFDLVIVDCGGHDNLALRSALTVANVLVTTFRPNHRDLETLSHFGSMVKLAKKHNPAMISCSVLTQCPPQQNVSRIENAKKVLTDFGLPSVDAYTTYRVIYDDVDSQGLSVLDVNQQDKSKTEVISICKQIMSMISRG